jgi:hypothetical protein
MIGRPSSKVTRPKNVEFSSCKGKSVKSTANTGECYGTCMNRRNGRISNRQQNVSLMVK